MERTDATSLTNGNLEEHFCTINWIEGVNQGGNGTTHNERERENAIYDLFHLGSVI